jgi:flagellar assembly protein FliH
VSTPAPTGRRRWPTPVTLQHADPEVATPVAPQLTDSASSVAPIAWRSVADERALSSGDLAAHLARLERDAFAKGFAQGEAAGNETAARRGDAMVRRLTQALEDVAALRVQMIRDTEQQLVSLAVTIARHVVHREITATPEALTLLARAAMDRLGETTQVTVRLNPEDFDATVAARTQTEIGERVTVMADPRLPRGGCQIESDFGAVDAGVDAQLQELADALLSDSGFRHGGSR